MLRTIVPSINEESSAQLNVQSNTLIAKYIYNLKLKLLFIGVIFSV